MNASRFLSNSRKVIAVHAVCSLLHFTSTIVIACIATANHRDTAVYNTYVSREFFAYTDWRIYCYNNASGTYSKYIEDSTPESECPDSAKLFFVEPGKNVFSTPVNILYLALTFTSVSALVHAFSAVLVFYKRSSIVIDSLLRLMLDYAISAPCMLALVNIVFGANCVAGVILAPTLLFVALQISGLTMYAAFDHPDRQQPRSVLAPWFKLTVPGRSLQTAPLCAMFTVLIAMYCIALVPTIIAMVNVAELAPSAVVVFMVGLLVAFSSFIVPYALELFYIKEYGYFVAYAALSLNAKAILHSFLAVSVLQQAELYDNSLVNVSANNLPPPPDMTSQTQEAYIIVLVTPVVGFALFLLLNTYSNPLRPPRDTHASLHKYLL